jgi:2-phosphosulfolactate phosphatase
MKCIVHISPVNLDELYFTGKTIVVIDVLRASNTIITALSNGARDIVPVGSIEFAVRISGGMFGGQTLLGGERNTKKIDGFALGNSPTEYSEEIVSGKSIVFYTTNGSKAIAKAKFSENLFVCSFSNISAIANLLADLNLDFEILCAGRNNSFSLEDSVCAGNLIAKTQESHKGLNLNDSSTACLTLYRNYETDILGMLKNSDHGKLLIENGFQEDINICSEVDNVKVIPFFRENVVKLMRNNNPSILREKTKSINGNQEKIPS